MIKSKPCIIDGCNYPRFGKGYCKKHQYLRTDIKKTINKVSVKRKEQLGEYKDLRGKYLSENPHCEVKECPNTATEIHHKRHERTNKHLNDVTQFMSVCRRCHNKIHENPEWAKKYGYLINK